eukprot:tig00020965_g16857.t1
MRLLADTLRAAEASFGVIRKTEINGVPTGAVSVTWPVERDISQHELALLETIVRDDWDSFIPELDGGDSEVDPDPEEVAAYTTLLKAHGISFGMIRTTEFAGGLAGAIGIVWSARREISDHDFALYESVCDVVGCAIGQTTILNDLEEKNRLLQLEARSAPRASKSIFREPHMYTCTQYAARTAALEHRLRSEALLRDISAGIRSKRSLCEITVETASRVRELFDADCVAIHCLFGLPQEFRVVQLRGAQEPLIESPPQDSAAHAYRIRRLHFGHPARTTLVKNWEDFIPGVDSGGPGEVPDQMELLRERLRALSIRFGMSRGMEFSGNLIGVLCVSWRQEREISPHEIALFEVTGRPHFDFAFHTATNAHAQSVADAVGCATGQAQLLHDLEKKNAELEAEVPPNK